MLTCGSTFTLTMQYGLSEAVVPVEPVVTSRILAGASAVRAVAPMPCIVQALVGLMEMLSATSGSEAASAPLLPPQPPKVAAARPTIAAPANHGLRIAFNALSCEMKGRLHGQSRHASCRFRSVFQRMRTPKGKC